VMESRDVMNIHVVEHSILNGIEYCTFWFRSVVEMTRHQLLLQEDGNRAKRVDTGRPKRRFDISRYKGLSSSRYISLGPFDSRYSSSI
jgi:hypothetical protein